MRTKTIDVPDWAHDMLRTMITQQDRGDCLIITEKLPRDKYEALNKLLEAFGGKWIRKLKAHQFAEDPRERIRAALGDGSVKVESIVNKQQTFGQFFTPPDLASRMVDEAEIARHHRVLEPSAGEGAILDYLPVHSVTGIVAIELDPDLYAKLQEQYGKRVALYNCDFLDTMPAKPFDRIVMNPPFANGLDIVHIKHAFKQLADGGRIVAICANGSKQNEKLKTLTDTWEDLPDGTFKDSGTMVNSALITINK